MYVHINNHPSAYLIYLSVMCRCRTLLWHALQSPGFEASESEAPLSPQEDPGPARKKRLKRELRALNLRLFGRGDVQDAAVDFGMQSQELQNLQPHPTA